MAENDYTIIKPVDGMQNIGNMTPVERQKERKRKKQQKKQQKPQLPDKQPDDNEPNGNKKDQSSIDYRA